MKILICENGSLGETCAELLSMNNIETVIMKENYEDILEIVRNDKFDFAILNYDIACQKLIDIIRSENVKVIVMTSYEQLKFNADVVLLKPFGFDELLWWIRKGLA